MQKQTLNHYLKRIPFFVAFLLLGAYCIIFNNDTGWSLFFFSSLLLLISVLNLVPSLKKIQAEIEESIQSPQGEAVILPVQIFRYRPTLIPMAQLQVHFQDGAVSQTKIFYFYFGNIRRIRFTWHPPVRGVYTQLPLQVNSRDFFGLFSKNHTLQLSQKMVILPKKHASTLDLIPLFTKKNRHFLIGEPNFTIRNYRQYQSGDSLKNIDWKLSSKQQELMYREQEVTRDQPLTILFWGEASPYFEETLSLFYSLQEYLSAFKHQQVLLLGTGIDSYFELDGEAFAKVQPFQNEIELPKLKQRDLLIIAPEQSPFLQEQIRHLKRYNQVQVMDYPSLMAAASENLSEQEVTSE